jgi:hypothetical protein
MQSRSRLWNRLCALEYVSYTKKSGADSGDNVCLTSVYWYMTIEYIALKLHGLNNFKIYKHLSNCNSSDFNLVSSYFDCWPGRQTHCLFIDFLSPSRKI